MQLTDIRIKLCEMHGQSQGNLHGNIQGSVHAASRDNRRPMSGGNGGGNHAAQGNRLKAFCALTFDGAFVIRDVKLIDGNDGLFVAMPSRKICDRCARCGDKNHLRARYCNNCGARLDENRVFRALRGSRPGMPQAGSVFGRVKLHADIAHPINADCRHGIEQDVINAFWQEVEKSKLPGYVPPNLDGEDVDYLDPRPLGGELAGEEPSVHAMSGENNEHSISAVAVQ